MSERRAGLSSRVALAVGGLAVAPSLVSVLAHGAHGSSIALFASSSCGAVLAWWLCRDTAERVSLLERALSRAGEGDASVRVRPRGADEAGAALTAFNAMMDTVDVLRARAEELERISAWQEFARRLAHEIKNPLTPIQLAVQEVARKYQGGDPAFERTLATAREIVEEEVETLRRLVTAFSEFARLPEVRPVRADLAEFVRDAGEGHSLITASESSQSAAVQWLAGEGPVQVQIDRILLRRAVDNLVRNAAQAGAKNITVRIERLPAERGEVHLVIEDDGPGIAQSERAKVFEPYFTTKSATGGTGLGLAIVRKIALDHDGDVVLDEAYTRGARFVLALPVSSETGRASSTFVTLRAKPARER
ncbi:MAG: ATP-binding protein [Polyangiales bacterium]